MPQISDIAPYVDELTAIRRDLHAHPELGFEEVRTSAMVADKLTEFGVDEVHTGIARTGVVGVLRGSGGSNRAIGLRADMDALPIHETNTFAHRSRNDGLMHACGHDGHTTMLLGAARYLAEHRKFDGTVYLIFQPAEENAGGGGVMVEEGLFERFPVEQVYALHNMPGMPLGDFAMCPGPCMASADEFSITITGRGGHVAMPDRTCNPVLAGAQIVTALATAVGQNVNPLHGGLIAVPVFEAGDATNVVPQQITLRGTARSLTPSVRDTLEEQVKRISTGIAAAAGASAEVEYHRFYPPTVNAEEETRTAADVAASIVGAGRVNANAAPEMGSEDFSFMLEKRPGCFAWIGNGVSAGKGGVMLHNPAYDFNDDVIAYGVGYWTQLVETTLPDPAA